MKKLFLIVFLFVIGLSSCEKGDTGPEGPAGAAGEVGPAGKDGSVILSGTTAPKATDGKVGDYYLDLTTSALYGPKTATGWGNAIDLKGSKGDAGTLILSGTGAPTLSIGKDGDYYLDKSGNKLYGPRTTTEGVVSWGTALNIKGDAGSDGSKILAGDEAPSLLSGDLGDFYIDKTTCTLYGPKSRLGWGTGVSLKGAKGDNGINGTNGTNGAAGSQILKGNGQPASTLGVAGDFYLDQTNFLLYGPKTASWGAGLQLGAPALTYIFNTPYLCVDNYQYGVFKFSFASFNYSVNMADNGLALVYLQRTYTWHLANGEVGGGNVWFKARYNFDTFEKMLYLYITPLNSNTWSSLDQFKGGTNLSAIKIVIIPPGKVTTIGSLAAKTHDNVMQALAFP